MPVTVVRSSGSSTAARNAETSAWLMEARVARGIRRVATPARCGVRGTRSRNIADGKCVNNICGGCENRSQESMLSKGKGW